MQPQVVVVDSGKRRHGGILHNLVYSALGMNNGGVTVVGQPQQQPMYAPQQPQPVYAPQAQPQYYQAPAVQQPPDGSASTDLRSAASHVSTVKVADSGNERVSSVSRARNNRNLEWECSRWWMINRVA